MYTNVSTQTHVPEAEFEYQKKKFSPHIYKEELTILTQIQSAIPVTNGCQGDYTSFSQSRRLKKFMAPLPSENNNSTVI